jgi:hypothetical protein
MMALYRRHVAGRVRRWRRRYNAIIHRWGRQRVEHVAICESAQQRR